MAPSLRAPEPDPGVPASGRGGPQPAAPSERGAGLPNVWSLPPRARSGSRQRGQVQRPLHSGRPLGGVAPASWTRGRPPPSCKVRAAAVSCGFSERGQRRHGLWPVPTRAFPSVHSLPGGGRREHRLDEGRPRRSSQGARKIRTGRSLLLCPGCRFLSQSSRGDP